MPTYTPLSHDFQHNVDLYTFQDAVERLLDNFGEYQKDGRNHRMAREAVLTAYRDLPSMHPWSYYKRRHLFQSSPAFSQGNVNYLVSTGVNGLREWTLTDVTASWPADAEFGMIQHNEAHYPVVQRVSNTVVLTDQDQSPTADFTNGSFEWFRESYPFPARTRRMGELTDARDYSFLSYVSPEEGLIMSRSRSVSTINRPYTFTIRNDDRYLNNLSIMLIPPPNTERTYEFVEEASGQELVEERLNDNATVTAGSDVLALAGGATLTIGKHEGCVVRFSPVGVANDPTTLRGTLNEYQPFCEQRIIRSLTTPVLGTLDAPLTQTGVVRVSISSPIDIELHTMKSLFQCYCDYIFVSISDDKGVSERQFHERKYREALAYAMNADRRSNDVQTANRVNDLDGWLPTGRVENLT